MSTTEPATHWVRVPELHGPIHDWFVIGDWLHHQMHEEDLKHEHHPETLETLPR